MGGGGGLNVFACMCVQEKTGQEKKCLSECSLKVTRPDGKCSKILVCNPVISVMSIVWH